MNQVATTVSTRTGMRFHRIDLLRYGMFTERNIEFPPMEPDFHLVAGANETGKSTLRSAISDLLFGIEHRSPSRIRASPW